MKERIHNTPQKKQVRRELRQRQTPQEGLLWSILRNRGLGYKFKRQYSIGPYIADFFCAEKRLIIEVDGSQHIENQAYDNERTVYLEVMGCTVLRFWNNEVDKNTDGVIMKIRETLESTSP